MRRLRRYQELHELDLPIIVLVGGATGTGKSTVATEVAYRLGITRVTSTDFVRQTMRAFFSQRVHAVDPLLELRGRARDRPRTDDRRCVDGFLEQTRERPRRRARRDRARARRRAGRWCSRASTSCPGCCRRVEGALVVQCVLAIEDEEAHARALLGPRRATRRACGPCEQYLDALRRHPPAPGRTSSSGRARARRAGDREREHRATRSATVMELVLERAERLEARRDARRSRDRRDRAGHEARSASASRTRARPSGPRSPARAGSGAPTRRRRRRRRRPACARRSTQLPIDGRIVIGAGDDERQPRAGRDDRRRRRARSTSRSTRSRAAASSRAAATARCR